MTHHFSSTNSPSSFGMQPTAGVPLGSVAQPAAPGVARPAAARTTAPPAEPPSTTTMPAKPAAGAQAVETQGPSLEQQIEQLKQQLVDAQKLTALGELVGTTTHEFNNVLMTVINYAKMGLRHKDEATRDKAFTKILAAGERAEKITGSVLAMARNRSSQKEPTELAKLVEESLLLLEREMNKYRIAVECEFSPTPPALVHGNQIQQVLMNLMINARQAMPNGGRLIIRISHDEAARTADLYLRDTGSGMEPEKLRRIFEPFFTTKAGPDATGKGGTGLGLAACKDIIDSHRGKIQVQSTVGKGTAFTIKLPLA